MILHGITLADFPTEIDTIELPYIQILREADEDVGYMYSAIITSQPMYYNPTANLYGYEVPYDNALCSTYEGLDTWAIIGGTTVTEPSESESFLDKTFWINYDILNIETGEVHMKSYNNVPLPPLPSDIDRTVYPYAYVIKAYMSEYDFTSYMFMVTDKEIQNDSESVVVLSGTKMISGSISTLKDAWENISSDEITVDTPMVQDGMTMTIIWSEVAEEKLYVIKEGILKSIADSIRAKTGTTDLITPENMPTEIEAIKTTPTLQDLTITENGTYSADTDSGYDGLGEVTINVENEGILPVTDGYVVSFYDSKGNIIQIDSLKQGMSVSKPSYVTTKWLDEDSNEMVFPYTPTSDINIYAYEGTAETLLYANFGIDKETYPYLYISNQNRTGQYSFIFAKTFRVGASYDMYVTGKFASVAKSTDYGDNVKELAKALIANVTSWRDIYSETYDTPNSPYIWYVNQEAYDVLSAVTSWDFTPTYYKLDD